MRKIALAIAATAGNSGDPVFGRFAVAKSGPAIFAIGVGQPDKIESLANMVSALVDISRASPIGKIAKHGSNDGIDTIVNGPA